MPEQKPAQADSPPKRDGKLRWVLGWIVLPGTLLAGLFLAGVHVGARHPDRVLARTLLKLFDAEPGVAAAPEQPRYEPRPGAKPGAPFEVSALLQRKQMQAIADKSLGSSVDELPCVDVCRAYAKSEYEVAPYSIERCELVRSIDSAPTMLDCAGTLEAIKATKPDADEQRADESAR